MPSRTNEVVESFETLYTTGSQGQKFALTEIRGDWKFQKACFLYTQYAIAPQNVNIDLEVYHIWGLDQGVNTNQCISV